MSSKTFKANRFLLFSKMTTSNIEMQFVFICHFRIVFFSHRRPLCDFFSPNFFNWNSDTVAFVCPIIIIFILYSQPYQYIVDQHMNGYHVKSLQVVVMAAHWQDILQDGEFSCRWFPYLSRHNTIVIRRLFIYATCLLTLPPEQKKNMSLIIFRTTTLTLTTVGLVISLDYRLPNFKMRF